jgi:hypothetical protein
VNLKRRSLIRHKTFSNMMQDIKSIFNFKKALLNQNQSNMSQNVSQSINQSAKQNQSNVENSMDMNSSSSNPDKI